jgi:hypothetical protein
LVPHIFVFEPIFTTLRASRWASTAGDRRGRLARAMSPTLESSRARVFRQRETSALGAKFWVLADTKRPIAEKTRYMLRSVSRWIRFAEKSDKPHDPKQVVLFTCAW